MEIVGKAAIEEFKIDSDSKQKLMNFLKDTFETKMKENKDLDIKGLDALVKMAIAQQKEMKNDEER